VAVGNSVSLVVMPEELNGFITLVVERDHDWLAPRSGFIVVDVDSVVIDSVVDGHVIHSEAHAIGSYGTPWVSSIGMLNVGVVDTKSTIVDQISLVIVPVDFCGNISLVLECQFAGVFRVDRLVMGVLFDVDGPSGVFSLGDPDIVTVDVEGAVALDIPWMRSVSVHLSVSSCFNNTVGHLDSLVVVPHQFEVLVALIHEGNFDWLVPSD